jgi:MAP3K TRAFs-binding domain
MTQSQIQDSMNSIARLRAQRHWQGVIAFIRALPPSVAETEVIQQQLGFSLNRAGADSEAESVLKKLLLRPGDHSETLGILGRVHKDRWEHTRGTDPGVAEKHLLEAIDTYSRGFQMNSDNAYPGINLVSLLTIRDPAEPRLPELCKAVEQAVGLKLRAGVTDYFDYATKVELCVLSKQPVEARTSLGIALAKIREPWEPETTAHNLRLIRMAREARGDKLPWVLNVEGELLARAGLPDPQSRFASA